MNIVPKPNQIELLDGAPFLLTKTTGLLLTNPTHRTLFLQFAKAFLSLPPLAEGEDIRFLLVPEDAQQNPEGYTLLVTSDGVTITAQTDAGLFFGMQTLFLLCLSHKTEQGAALPPQKIVDAPRFSYRGFMLDVARHFYPVKEVLRLVDALALLKFNTLHLHLVDDQGWRFASKKFPRLTEIGASRLETRGDETPVSGFFSQSDLKQIVAYAAERHIEVIPEFDMPGHASALLAAYPQLKCDHQPPVEVATNFGIKEAIVCAGKEEVYQFFFDLLDEVVQIFPSRYVHLGGDEARKVFWNSCPRCQAAMQEHGLKTANELQAHFMGRIIDHLKQHGKVAVVWNEAQNGGNLDNSAVLQFWNDGKHFERVIAAANNGRKMIVSKFSPFYLDYPHGLHPLRRLYEFDPVLNGIQEDAKHNVLGVESPIWTEHLPDIQSLHLMVFPRLLATAETAWTQQNQKDYTGFESRAATPIAALAKMGIVGTPLKKTNPNKLKSLCQVVRFFANAMDWQNLKGMRNHLREERLAKKEANQ